MSWNDQEIQQLLSDLRVRRGDSTTVEVKRAAGGLPEGLERTVCAFANMPDGGTIMLGVDERSGFQAVGVSEPAAMEAGLVNQARKRVIPVPSIATSTVIIDSKPVVIAEVAPLRLTDRPATVDGRAYLRQADGNFVMHDHELAMIEVDKILTIESKDYDKRVVEGLTVDDLVASIVQRYLESARKRSSRLADRSDEEILRRTGVLAASGEPTLAGLYAMGDYPQGHFPSLTVTAAVQIPTDMSGVRNRDLQHFEGPIPVLLDELVDWCSRNLLSVRAYRSDGHMAEVPEIPLSAARELIANALVHRDLSPNTLGVGQQIQIRLTPSNLFILSPGGLRGVSLQQLTSEDHAQAAVNQRLYAIARNLTTEDGSPIIEGEGGGIREVFRSAAERGLAEPTLINTGVQFKALLWRPASPIELPSAAPTARHEEQSPSGPVETPDQITDVLSKNEPALLQALRDSGQASFQQLRSILPLSSGQIRYALDHAIREGRVEMVGRQGKRDTVYRIRPHSSGREAQAHD